MASRGAQPPNSRRENYVFPLQFCDFPNLCYVEGSYRSGFTLTNTLWYTDGRPLKSQIGPSCSFVIVLGLHPKKGQAVQPFPVRAVSLELSLSYRLSYWLASSPNFGRFLTVQLV